MIHKPNMAFPCVLVQFTSLDSLLLTLPWLNRDRLRQVAFSCVRCGTSFEAIGKPWPSCPVGQPPGRRVLNPEAKAAAEKPPVRRALTPAVRRKLRNWQI